MSSHMKIPLSYGLFATIDVADAGLVSNRKWYAQKSKYTYYAIRSEIIDGKQRTIYMHRVLLDARPGEVVDHKDGDGLNNIRSNLRPASVEQNLANSKVRKHNKVGVKGVEKKKSGRFRARIRVAGKRITLGCYATAKEAHEAYMVAARRFYGEFARSF